MTFAPNPAGTRLLTLTIGTTDWTGQVTNAEIDVADSDSDTTTFSDAASGGSKLFTLVFTCVDDYQASSLWDEAWSHAGDTIAFVLAPYGGVASATNPQFSGNAVISLPDGKVIGGAADASTSARFTSDFAWPCTAKPSRVTA